MRWILTLLVLAALGYGGWRWTHRGPTATVYDTAEVTKGEMTQLVTATGTLNPVTNVQVGSQISGNIQKLFADFNSSVKKGEIVAQLDPAIYLAVVHQCEGDLASSKSALELTALTAKRKEDLVQQHAAPQADLDTAYANLHQAQAAVQVKQANLERSKADLDHCSIYSPIDGTVISRAVDVGQTVAAAMNAPVLFTVAADLTKMQIDSAVAEADVGTLEVDQTVDFTVDAFPFRTFHGTVKQVRNAATTVQNVVTYDVVIAVSNDDLKLKPGMTTNLSVIVAHRDEAVKLPNAALRFRPPAAPLAAASPGGSAPGTGAPAGGGRPPGGGGGHRGGGGGHGQDRTVYVLKPGATAPEAVPVKLGISDGITTEVLSGLEAGQKLVIGIISEPESQKPSNPLSGGPRFR